MKELRFDPPGGAEPRVVPVGRDFVDWFGLCPDCHGARWLEGPHGGNCVNVACADCGTRLNVSAWRGTLLVAQRIEP